MENITKNDCIEALLTILARESNNHCFGDKQIPTATLRAFLEKEKN